MTREAAPEATETALIGEVLSGVFVRPTRFRDGLHSDGIKLGVDEPIGVATLASIQQELELQGLSREDRRRIATQITGGLLRGEQNQLFQGMVRVEKINQGSEIIFYRNDISRDKVTERYEKYSQLLADEVEVSRREREELQRQKQEEKAQKPKKQAAKKEAPALDIVVIGSPDVASFDQTMTILRQQVGSGRRVDVLPVDFSDFRDPTASLLDRRDVRFILESGISTPALTDMLPDIRIAIATAVEGIEAYALSAATFIAKEAQERNKQARKDTLMAVCSPAALATSLYKHIFGIGFVERPVPQVVTDLYKGITPSYPVELVRRWNLKSAYSEDGNPVEVLPDDLLVRAIFADIIGEIYPLAYVYEGSKKEMGFLGLRIVAEDFSIPEIYSLLSPQTFDADEYKKGVDKLKQEIGDLDKQIRSAKGAQARTLQKEKDLMMADLRRRVAGSKSRKSNSDLIQEAIGAHTPEKSPEPEDYTKGELSEGFVEARRRFQRLLERDPNRKAPDPNDYLRGENSGGYVEAHDLYASRWYNDPSIESRRSRYPNKENVTENLPSLVGKRIV